MNRRIRYRNHLVVGYAGLLFPRCVFLLAQLIGLGVGHVTELLDSSGEDLRGENAVCLVDRDADHPLEHAGKKSMATETNEQLRVVIEDLHPILHPVDHPDMVITVNGNPFGPREVSWAVAGFAKGTDEFAVAIEDLDAVVEGISHVEIAVPVDRQSPWPGEISRRGEFVFVPAGADPTLQLQSVSVVNQNLILVDVSNIEKPIFGIDGQPTRFDQSVSDNVFRLVLWR